MSEFIQFRQSDFTLRHRRFNESLAIEKKYLAQSLEIYNKQHNNNADDDNKTQILGLIENEKQKINRYRVELKSLYENINKNFNQTNQYLDEMEDIMWITEKIIKPELDSLQTMARNAYKKDSKFKKTSPLPPHIQSVVDDTVGGRRKSHKKTYKRNKK